MEARRVKKLVSKPILHHRFAAAMTMAHELHHRQIRKGSKVPYIGHLLISRIET